MQDKCHNNEIGESSCVLLERKSLGVTRAAFYLR